MWTDGEKLALSQPKCTHCLGTGSKLGPEGYENVCSCVLRAVFRACMNRFRKAQITSGYMKITTAPGRGQRARANVYGFKQNEYMADLVLIARRALREPQYKLFDLHFLKGLDCNACAPALGLNRGQFFHEVYRVEERLGRAFRDTQPHPLFPLDEYFGGKTAVEPLKRAA